ncbi:MAG TPA: hypothetical protein VFX70_05545 [Mycobacteriales bacterium]|nr:hypothetical protein [Mycobacteriales bacterium]
MKSTLAVVALCGLGLTACTTTVPGHGSVDQNLAAPAPSGSSPGGSPAGPTGGRHSLSCHDGTVVSPKDAPYCYLVPAGLHVISDIVLPGGGDFTTAVGIGGRDVIAVTVFRTPANTDELGDDELRQDTDRVVDSQLSGDFAFKSKVGERLTVDGARTLHYSATSKKEPFNIDIYFVYRAKAKVQINCQSKDHRDQIDAGCATLLHSLQFESVN